MVDYLPIVVAETGYRLSASNERKIAEILLHHFELSCAESTPTISRERDLWADIRRNFNDEVVSHLRIIDTSLRSKEDIHD